MSRVAAGHVVAIVAVLLCIVGLTAAAFLAIRYLDLHTKLASLPLAVIVIVFGTVLVRLVLLAVDNWIDRSEREPSDGAGP